MLAEPATGPIELGPGRWLGRYELVYPLACGGMAEVWLAKLHGPHGFEKLVALKTILPSLAEDPRFRRMFVDEARIAAGIEHVNVAHIWDLGEQAGLLFLAMEWVDGDSLQKLERAAQRAGETLPVSVLVRIMADVCAGLHAAHELADLQGKSLNVVHRDVSPQNILISASGVAKVIDFGVAKARPGRSEDTATGTIKGKLQYMAPEQALGQPSDRRADIWSVGATLYRLLARRPLFSSVGPLSIIKRLRSPDPPTPLPSSVPSALSSIVHKALAFEPARRYATAAELGAALEELLCGPNHVTSRDVASCLERYLGSALSSRREGIGGALTACATPETASPHEAMSLVAPADAQEVSGASPLSPTARSAEPSEPAPAPSEPGAIASVPAQEETTRPFGGVALRSPPSGRPDPKTRAPALLALLAFGTCAAWLIASSSGGPTTTPPPSPPAHRASLPAPADVVATVSANPRVVLPVLPAPSLLLPVREASEPSRVAQVPAPAAQSKAKRGARVPAPRKRIAPSAAPPGLALATAKEVIDDGF